jgi:hypothetical protein
MTYAALGALGLKKRQFIIVGAAIIFVRGVKSQDSGLGSSSLRSESRYALSLGF